MRLMAAFWVALKSAWYNRRLEVGLLLGLTLAVAVAAAIPMYSSASLQRGLMRTWIESSTLRPPFAMLMSYSQIGDVQTDPLAMYQQLNSYLERAVFQLDLPLITYATAGALGVHRFQPVDATRPTSPSPFADVWTMSNLTEVAQLTEGRWPEPFAFDDPHHFEVVVSETTLDYLHVFVGTDYRYTFGTGENETQLVLHIVGAFRPSDEALDTARWVLAPPFQNIFFVDVKDFTLRLLGEGQLAPSSLDWYWVWDHSAVRTHDLPHYIQKLTALETRVGQIAPGTRLWTSPLALFRTYAQRVAHVERFLLALSWPLFALVLYYITLIAGLAVTNRAQEIATLRSRGATRSQILLGFALEWGGLGVLALLFGPLLGWYAARLMGASAGFLSFVDRVALPVRLNADAYRFGLLAVGTAWIAALLPALSAMRYSVATLKNMHDDKQQPAFWHRYFVDIALLAAAYVSYRQLKQGSGLLATFDATVNVPFDPALFLAPFLFSLGSGLFVLRILPLLLRFVSWGTARWGGVAWSLTWRHVERNIRQYSPFMLLLMVTTALGLYAACAARTMQQNIYDQIAYRYGADIVLDEQWRRTTFVTSETSDVDELVPVEEVFEPPFYIHEHLPGVIAAARVLERTAQIQIGNVAHGEVNILGIVPQEFATVAAFRHRLLPAHHNHYLNALIQHPQGVLASADFLQRHGLNVGDWITFNINNQPIEAYIVASIDYWPRLNPQEGPIFVLHLDHIQEHTVMEPYSVWLRLNADAELQRIVDALAEEGIYVVRFDDARREMIAANNDPLRMGMYGILTIGFVVSGIVTVSGLFLFYLLSLRRRKMQFGVLRAMGLSMRQLIASLTWEGLLTVGSGLSFGSLFGFAATYVFLPFFQVAGDMVDSVPPFVVVIDATDLKVIYVTLLLFLTCGVLWLGPVLHKAKLHEAVKLGEEA